MPCTEIVKDSGLENCALYHFSKNKETLLLLSGVS